MNYDRHYTIQEYNNIMLKRKNNFKKIVIMMFYKYVYFPKI